MGHGPECTYFSIALYCFFAHPFAQRVKKWIKNHRKRLVYDLPSPGPHRQANGIRKAPLRTRAKCARDVILKCDGPSAAKFRELNKCHRERTITKNEKMAMWGTFISQRLQRPEVMALCQAKAQECNSRTVKTVSPAPPSLIRDDLSSQTDLVEIGTGVYSGDLSSPALPASSRDLRLPSPPVDLFGWSHNRGRALVDWEDNFMFLCSQVLNEIGFVSPPFDDMILS